MDINECSELEYRNHVTNPFSVFDSVEFTSLNQHKADDIKHLVFNDGKNRFGLIAGIKNNAFLIPFSAPYSCLSPISKDNKIKYYNEASEALVRYAKKLKLNLIRITLPPLFYDENHITKLFNSFYISGFSIKGCDLNFHYNLDRFDDNYEMNIDPKARQKLRSAHKNELTFEKTTDLDTVYKIIEENRSNKKYPLWMTKEEILKTIQIIKSDLFLVHDSNNTPIASAMIYHMRNDRVQVIYWGNRPNTEHLKPMNFLSFKTFEYYKSNNVRLIDIGPSTEFSIPNFGLCDFKQSIGCNTSSKITLELLI